MKNAIWIDPAVARELFRGRWPEGKAAIALAEVEALMGYSKDYPMPPKFLDSLIGQGVLELRFAPGGFNYALTEGKGTADGS